MHTREIILASQSPQRKQILETLGLDFKCVPADIDEHLVVAPTQELRAQKIAQAKAEKIAKQNPDSIIIAGDTFVVLEDRALEKPKSLQEAVEMLTLQSGKTVRAMTGVCYIDPMANLRFETTVVTEFTFRNLSFQEIASYVKNNPVLTWSAAFSPAYPAGAAFVADVRGSLTCLTHGLPIENIAEYVRQSGVSI